MKNSVCLKCGFAKEDITPQIPVVMDGFAAREGKSRGIRDPLLLRVIAIKDSEGMNCLFVIMDLIGLNDSLATGIKNRIQDKFAFPLERIILISTHTHSGPAAGVLSGLEISEPYISMVFDKLSKAVENALGNLEDMTLDVVTGDVHIGVNRRCFLNGRIQIGENFDAPRDDTLRVLRFTRGDNLAGVWLNASCHPVNLDARNTLISADYPGVLYQKLAQMHPEVFSAFTNSSAGNMNPIILEGESQEEALNRNGAELVRAFDAIVDRPVPNAVEKGRIKVLKAEVDVPVYIERDAETLRKKLEFYREKLRNSKTDTERYVATTYADWYQARLDEIEEPVGDCLKTSIQLCCLDEKIWVLALPFEVFVETKAKILKQAAALGVAPEQILLCSCANAVKAYLPTPEAIAEGGYEVESSYIWYGLPGRYTAQSEPSVVQACLKLIGNSMSKVGWGNGK